MKRYFPPMAFSLRSCVLPLVLLGAGCATAPNPDSDHPSDSSDMSPEPDRLDIQGHRGARGLLPENTIPGFVLAIREGADVLEMDLCIAGDGSVIVSHEPWMNHEICRTPQGEDIAEADERTHNLHAMTVAQIQAYDCGTREHPRFPDQTHLPVAKPTLADVVKVTETVPLLDGGALRYNLEIKHRPDLEPTFCPDANAFAQAVVEEVERLGIADRTCIQSFSPAVMEAMHVLRPDMTVAWLVGEPGPVEAQLARLSFAPDIYSPDWKLIDANDVHALQSQGIQVIPWTVNSQQDLYRVMEMGVDGIITDYPDRLYAMR